MFWKTNKKTPKNIPSLWKKIFRVFYIYFLFFWIFWLRHFRIFLFFLKIIPGGSVPRAPQLARGTTTRQISDRLSGPARLSSGPVGWETSWLYWNWVWVGSVGTDLGQDWFFDQVGLVLVSLTVSDLEPLSDLMPLGWISFWVGLTQNLFWPAQFCYRAHSDLKT